MNADSGYDLYYLANNLQAFQQLIDKTYHTLNDEKYTSGNKRQDIKIKVHNIREGSFLADLYIEVAAVIGSLFPMVTEINAKNVWDVAKSSFDYLKSILQANARGESLSLEIKDSETVQVVTGSNNTIINVHPDIVRVANENYSTFRKISSMIDEKKDDFTKAIFAPVNALNDEIIEIGIEEKILFQNKSIIEELPIKFKGKIFKADAEKYTGKMKIYGNTEIDDGEYNFEFLDKETVEMKDYFDVDCEFLAMKQTNFKPETLNKTIKQLKIIRVSKI